MPAQSRTICPDDKIIQDSSCNFDFSFRKLYIGCPEWGFVFLSVWAFVFLLSRTYWCLYFCTALLDYFYLIMYLYCHVNVYLLYPSKRDIGCGVHLTGCRLVAIWKLHHIHLICWPKYIFGQYFEHKYNYLSNS